MQAVNGLGATIEISAVRFEGYFVPLTKPVAATPEPQPAPTQEAQNAQAAVDVPSAITPLDMQDPKHISTGNTRLPSQPPIIPEIDQQAITFWNQNRFADAFPLFNQACSGGKMNSCYYLGLMYDFGQGVMQDSSRAAAFYTKACNAGNRAACYHRAMLPQFVPGGCNTGAVIPNLSRSCNMGIATSCSMVGYSYIHGCGVAKNAEKGRHLLIKGCSLGDSDACDGIK
jgi:TPR repeat protein